MRYAERSPLSTGLLSVLATGLGHIYLGQAKRGVYFILLKLLSYLMFLALLQIYSGPFNPAILLLASNVPIGVYIYQIIDAIRLARKPTPFIPKSYNRWYIYLLVIAITFAGTTGLTTGAKVFVTQSYKIPSGAMLPTLLIGDHIFVDKLAYRLGLPSRYDIIVFPYPEDETKSFVKRVIGMPGDTIQIQDKKVSVNGQPLMDEAYTQRIDPGIVDGHINPRDNLGPLTVPPNSYFVMGDNRDQSLDSRFWGFVKKEKIIGKVDRIYWSWNSQASGIEAVRWARIGQLSTTPSFSSESVSPGNAISQTAVYTEKRWPVEDDVSNEISLSDTKHAPLCSSKTPLLTTTSLGPVRPGQTLAELENICTSLHYGKYWSEGMATPAALLRLGEASLMIEFSDETPNDQSKIWRVTTDSPVQTTDGFGPGALLSDMVKAWGRPSFGVGECELFAWFSTRSGLSFRVNLPDTQDWDCFAMSRLNDSALLPKNTRVGKVMLFMPESVFSKMENSSKAWKTSDVASSGTNRYLKMIEEKIDHQWVPPPHEANDLLAIVQFRLSLSGEVSNIHIDESSGNDQYDSAALKAVHAVNPLPPFPSDLKKSFIDVSYRFIKQE
ncbi:MAG: signal peptidase I [Nitrospirales bacterium]|nr:signal peptidase I [Nitrospirales bacterium]